MPHTKIKSLNLNFSGFNNDTNINTQRLFPSVKDLYITINRFSSTVLTESLNLWPNFVSLVLNFLNRDYQEIYFNLDSFLTGFNVEHLKILRGGGGKGFDLKCSAH